MMKIFHLGLYLHTNTPTQRASHMVNTKAHAYNPYWFFKHHFCCLKFICVCMCQNI